MAAWSSRCVGVGVSCPLYKKALSQLRLDIKYLVFDLEVTRQERDELRQQLEEG